MGKYDPLQEHLESQIGRVDKLHDEFCRNRGPCREIAGPRLASKAHGGRLRIPRKPRPMHGCRLAGECSQPIWEKGQQVTFSRDKTMTGAGNNLTSPPPAPTRVDRPSVNEAASLSNAKSIAEHSEPSNSASHQSLVGDLAIALGAATVAGVTAGVSGIIGVTHLPLWALALLSTAVGAAGFTVGQAITSREASDTARWWSISTVVILLMCTGAFTYHKFLDPLTHHPQTYQFVVNGDERNFIPLYGEAGGLKQSLATGYAGQNGLIGGQTYNFDCWAIGRDGAKWFRYQRFGQTWWAPNALLHFPAGENQTGMPHC